MGGSGIQTPMQIFSVAQHIMPKITSYTNYSFDHAKVDLIRTVSCDVKKKNKGHQMPLHKKNQQMLL